LQQSCRCTALLVQILTAALRRFPRLLLWHPPDRSWFQSLKKNTKKTGSRTVREQNHEQGEMKHEQRAN